MQFSVPAFLQVERGQYKSLLECNYHEFVSALMRENEPIREAQLSRLLRAKRDEWLAAPHILLADILLQHPGAQIRIRDWAIISESIAAAQRDIEGMRTARVKVHGFEPPQLVADVHLAVVPGGDLAREFD